MGDPRKMRGRTMRGLLMKTLTEEQKSRIHRALDVLINPPSYKRGEIWARLQRVELCSMDVTSHYAGGRAYLRRDVLEIHVSQFPGGVNEAHYERTLIHEIAHFLDYYLRGTSDHSSAWRKVYLALGCEWNPKERHFHQMVSMPGLRKRYKTYCLWTCKCGKQESEEDRYTSGFRKSKYYKWVHGACPMGGVFTYSGTIRKEVP